jgi:hypothetical membrane protein
VIVKIVAGIIAVILVIAFVLPVAIKLKDAPLAIVIVVGVVLMLIDVWQSLREKE